MVKSIYSYRYFLNKKYEAKWTEPILNRTLPYIDIFVLIGNVCTYLGMKFITSFFGDKEWT